MVAMKSILTAILFASLWFTIVEREYEEFQENSGKDTITCSSYEFPNCPLPDETLQVITGRIH